MLSFFSSKRLYFIAFVLIYISIQLHTYSINNKKYLVGVRGILNSSFAPFIYVSGNIKNTFRELWLGYVWLIDVAKEREELRSVVQKLNEEKHSLDNLKLENTQLRMLLQYPKLDNETRIAANVIGRDLTNWSKIVYLDRGSLQGIKVGSIVMEGVSLVGQVIAVTKNTSQVLLISDPQSSVDAFIENSAQTGIIEGRGGDVLELKYVPKEQQIVLGSRIISSGVDGVFPRGALIGYVNQVSSGGGGMFQRVEVESATKFNKLYLVSILTSSNSVVEELESYQDDNPKKSVKNILGESR